MALGTLGKSFSLIPQTRNLVTSGPYRLVRHPVYVGENGALGLVVWAATIGKTVVFLALIGCEVYRGAAGRKTFDGGFSRIQRLRCQNGAICPRTVLEGYKGSLLQSRLFALKGQNILARGIVPGQGRPGVAALKGRNIEFCKRLRGKGFKSRGIGSGKERLQTLNLPIAGVNAPGK